MVEGIQGRQEMANGTAGQARVRGDGESGVGFAPLLTQMLDGAPGQAEPAVPPRPGLSQALHCLLVPVRPQAGVQFAPAQLFDHRATAAVAAPPTAKEVKAAPVDIPTPISGDGAAYALSDYPRPVQDNGRGMHWIPTTHQSPEIVDQFMSRLEALGVRWVTFLNEPRDLKGNEYLVQRLTGAGIMPVMRIYTDGGSPLEEDVTALVKHYRPLGVSYFQLFNEPNMRCENQGQVPDVERYLSQWIPAAEQVLKAGGLPGFGALSPQGDVDDLSFLRDALEAIKARGAIHLLDKAWLSVHNYGQDYLRVRSYDRIIRDALGRSLPQIGTEAGIYPGGGVTEEDQSRIVTDAYRYMNRAEPYYFAYSLWALANQAGGGHDGRWEGQVLYRPDGPTSLASALERELGEA